MDACCNPNEERTAALEKAFGRVLWAVLAINAVMFLTELGAGLLVGSSALVSDSLDMLGDASLYAVSLFAVGRSARWRAGVSLLKGGAMGALGLVALGQAAWTLATGHVPHAGAMGIVATSALLSNAACAALLFAFRTGDLNMRSTWICSRNDVIANLGVILAAAGVAWSGSAWPDIVAGALIAAIVLHGAAAIVREALAPASTEPRRAA